MSDSVFAEEDSPASSCKTRQRDAVTPMSGESSNGGLEVFVEEEEQERDDRRQKQQQPSGSGTKVAQNGSKVLANGHGRSASVSPRPKKLMSTSGFPGKLFFYCYQALKTLSGT